MADAASFEKAGRWTLIRSFWRALRVALFTAAALGLLWLAVRTSNSIAGVRYFVLPDDAMISMRSARNLADGLGLVWNAGERLQGYTNPGWTLLMAGRYRLPIPERLTSLPLQMASIGFHLLTALVICRAVGRKLGDEWAIGATAAYLASSCATIWAISGWEGSAVTLGWTLALAPAIDPQPTRQGWWTSLIAAGITVILRPDAAMLGKNDERIARTHAHSGMAGHNHWDYDYSLNDDRPDLVITTYPLDRRGPSLELSGFQPITAYYQDLYDRAAFARHYLKNRVPIEFAGETAIFEA